jgi:hypothetical protein
VEFHGIALMLLATPTNRWGRGGMRAVVFPALFFQKSGLKHVYLNASFIFASLIYFTYRTQRTCVVSNES